MSTHLHWDGGQGAEGPNMGRAAMGQALGGVSYTCVCLMSSPPIDTTEWNHGAIFLPVGLKSRRRYLLVVATLATGLSRTLGPMRTDRQPHRAFLTPEWIHLFGKMTCNRFSSVCCPWAAGFI
uniref:Uncharacterized protein n=1 Tax=Myotis myotis TaxID=51298 RepID=A0A7J7V3U4_MYOMY|nr:hypothetical protein mMyoMyo1_008450 [Myotis myotis]